MRSLTHEYLTALRFDGTQAATLRTLGEYKGKQQLYAAQSPEALKGLRQIAVVESTESSNRLEGVVVAPSGLRPLAIRNDLISQLEVQLQQQVGDRTLFMIESELI